MKRSTGRHLVWILLAACLCAATPTAALAQRKKAGKGKLSDKAPEKPQDYSSRNFLLHSDLSPKEAHELLTRLETMLGLISTYWQRPSRGIIECYVAKDLDKWPAGSLRPEGRAKIAEGAGITLTQVISVGDQFKAKAVVYATADHGTPQHEAVHAYCGQAFGRTGPTWYSEGMAEMGQYWRKSDKRVQIGEYVLEYLQKSEPKSLREIVERNQFTGDSWQNYSWRWALCHLLANNPNYASRFRPLGMGLLTEQPVSFELTYGAMANEISFEYIFFIDHLENGLRADLCAWDWKKKFTPLKNTSKTLAARVVAGRGWQPTGLTAAKGHVYDLSTSGKWKTSKSAKTTDAEGNAQGEGRLFGVLLSDWKLSEPFAMGAAGQFVAPADGDLYVRCFDKWTSLDDNNGQMSVRLRFVKAESDADASVFISSKPAAVRVWRDASGKYSIKATLIAVKDGVVELRREDGKLVEIPFDKLSDEDKAFLKKPSGM